MNSRAGLSGRTAKVGVAAIVNFCGHIWCVCHVLRSPDRIEPELQKLGAIVIDVLVLHHQVSDVEYPLLIVEGAVQGQEYSQVRFADDAIAIQVVRDIIDVYYTVAVDVQHVVTGVAGPGEQASISVALALPLPLPPVVLFQRSKHSPVVL